MRVEDASSVCGLNNRIEKAGLSMRVEHEVSLCGFRMGLSMRGQSAG